MNKEVYEADIICMEVNPKTKKNTIQLEIEVDDFDFEEIKGIWCDNVSLDIKLVNI